MFITSLLSFLFSEADTLNHSLVPVHNHCSQKSNNWNEIANHKIEGGFDDSGGKGRTITRWGGVFDFSFFGRSSGSAVVVVVVVVVVDVGVTGVALVVVPSSSTVAGNRGDANVD